MKQSDLPAAAIATMDTLARALPPAQGADPHAEVMESPCMEVAAALDVKSVTQNHRDAGIEREHPAKVMAASRDAATRETISAKMKAGSPWKSRRT